MGEQVEEQINESNMNNSDVTFDNFTILRELSNISNIVRNEEFLAIVPKSKLKHVKWVPMFNCLKQSILDDMIQELNSMWQFENMPDKLEILEKQKEKFAELNPNQDAWRPQPNNVKAQLKSEEVVNLQKQKMLLTPLAKEYEMRINRLKKNITAKRAYFKALQMDIHKYKKKNDELISNIGEKIENHVKFTEIMIPVKTNVDDINWCEEDFREDE